MKTKVDIFSGFLGAGKTMLIKKLIREKLKEEQIFIIENEFGQISIDSKILKECDVLIKEINAGCICCTVSGDFKKAIKEIIKEYHPERIIIEPSGVAKLSEILDLFNDESFKEHIELNMLITVVDALKFNLYIKNFSEFYKNQIIKGKTIILSRTQLLSKEDVDRIVEEIEKLNPKAKIISDNWDNLDGDFIVNLGEEKELEENKEKYLKNNNILKTFKVKGVLRKKKLHNANESFETLCKRFNKEFSEDKLIKILESLDDENIFGRILRAKGIVKLNNKRWVQFDYVPKEIKFRETKNDSINSICIIGSNINKEALKNLFDF